MICNNIYIIYIYKYMADVVQVNAISGVHTSAYVSIRQHTHVAVRVHQLAVLHLCTICCIHKYI